MSELLYDKSLVKLELDQVLQHLSQCAGSSAGKEACLQIKPQTDAEDVRSLLEETSAACNLTIRKGNLGFSDVKDVSASVERANRGGSLQPRELLAIASVFRCARNVKNYITENDPPTVLDPLFHMLVPNKFLEEKIYHAIISEEEIADLGAGGRRAECCCGQRGIWGPERLGQCLQQPRSPRC